MTSAAGKKGDKKSNQAEKQAVAWLVRTQTSVLNARIFKCTGWHLSSNFWPHLPHDGGGTFAP